VRQVEWGRISKFELSGCLLTQRKDILLPCEWEVLTLSPRPSPRWCINVRPSTTLLDPERDFRQF
jgi:hypothetical protein